MKIKILSLIISICLFFTLSQNSAQAYEIGIGAKFGAGAGFLTGDDWDTYVGGQDNRPVLSFSLGFIFDLNFYQGQNMGFGIQPEVLYTYTGGGVTDTNYTDDFLERYFHTFQIPIYLKPRFGSGKSFIFLLLGPEFLISANKKYKNKFEGSWGSAVTKGRLDEGYSLGFSLGIGYDMVMGRGKLEIGVTYSHYLLGFGNDVWYQKDISNNILHVYIAASFNVVGGGGGNKEPAPPDN